VFVREKRDTARMFMIEVASVMAVKHAMTSILAHAVEASEKSISWGRAILEVVPCPRGFIAGNDNMLGVPPGKTSFDLDLSDVIVEALEQLLERHVAFKVVEHGNGVGIISIEPEGLPTTDRRNPDLVRCVPLEMPCCVGLSTAGGSNIKVNPECSLFASWRRALRAVPVKSGVLRDDVRELLKKLSLSFLWSLIPE
jgi:hypothetical protein